MHTVRKLRKDYDLNANWGYSLGAYTFTVDDVSGTGSITLTQPNGSGTPLGTNASYTPPNGTLPNGGNLGSAPNPPGSMNVTDVSWDGTNLSFSYSGFDYTAGQHQVGSIHTVFVGEIDLPDERKFSTSNWTATK